MGHAAGVVLAEKLSSSEDDEILVSWVQYLESDGVNVSKAFQNKLDE